MADRKDEKELRRTERLEQEQADQRAAARKRTFGRLGGLVLAAVAVAALIFVFTTDGGDDGVKAADSAAIREEAAAAGCEFKLADSEGRDHVEETLTKADFKTNPATSGNHNAVPAQDGFYQAGNEPDIANWVHSLEHGRVLFQFAKGTSAADVQKLRGLANEPLNDTPGYHTLVFQNNSEMPFKVAAVGWTTYVGCKDTSAAALKVMRTFRATYTDKAPELIP